MPFHYDVMCDSCGFHTTALRYGIISNSPCVFQVPVYDPRSGALFPCSFRETEIGLADLALAEWIEANGQEVIEREFGKEVVACSDLNAPSRFRCFNCGRETAHFRSAGF